MNQSDGLLAQTLVVIMSCLPWIGVQPEPEAEFTGIRKATTGLHVCHQGFFNIFLVLYSPVAAVLSQWLLSSSRYQQHEAETSPASNRSAHICRRSHFNIY